MTSDQFLEQFGYFVDAPNGIQKLRELVLQLAVQGNLVAQQKTDEPASALLDRLRQVKVRLTNNGEIKKQKRLSPIKPEERPFPLPRGWIWERLGNLTARIGSGSTPRGGKNAYVDSGIPFLRSQNVWNEGLKLNDVAYIPKEIHEKMRNTHVLAGDILLNITGASLGRTTIVPDSLSEANVSQHVTIIRPIVQDIGRFLHLAILSPFIQNFIWNRQVGMAREGLSKKVLELFEFPVPPLAEQHRIVAKVDELMVLCDRLEAERNARDETHQRLIRAVHHPLTEGNETSGKEGIDTSAAWHRIRDNFAGLYSSLESVDALRSTVLSLAVRGLLSEQNPEDEPASLFLERVEQEKKRIQRKGRRTSPESTEAEHTFLLPCSWEWRPLASVGLTGTGKTPSTREKVFWSDSGIPFIGPGQIKENGNITSADKFLSVQGKNEGVVGRDNDILMVCIGGSIGKTAIVRHELAFNQQINFISPLLIEPNYLYIALKAPFFQRAVVATATGSATPIINRSKWERICVPVPPLPEQKRIVTRVHELMFLCDQLETSIRAKEDTATHYAEAVVHQIAAA